MLIGCAGAIPKGRYGVDEFELPGADRIDDAAIKACLATHARERAGPVLGASEEPQCGVPPFDATRIPIDLWAWPWTDWPLYDDAIFTRDLDRIERFYRARGYYDATIAEVKQRKDEEDQTVALEVRVIEGEPVLVREVGVIGLEDLPEGERRRLEEEQQLRVGEPFDEAIYDESKQALLRALRELSFARAEVAGDVTVDPKTRTAGVKYLVKHGPATRIGRVEVSGHEDLPPRAIWGAAGIEENTPFSASALEDAKRAIYELGPFASVDVVEMPREGQPIVDILIKVVPGRRLRYGVGAGLQVGSDGSATTTYVTGDPNYWDLHLLGRIEHRNFLGGMRRISIEDRPRLIFDAAFPRTPTPQLGNLLSIEFRQPAFLEARTSLVASGRWDLGPDPYGGKFFRSDVIASIGPERSFFEGILTWSMTLNLNLFIPEKDSKTEPYPPYQVMYVQHAFGVDLRNDPRAPQRGAYFGLNVQHAGYFLPGDWDFIRVQPDIRGYLPLPLGIVLAGRIRIGLLEITESSIYVPSNDEVSPNVGYRTRLRDLGPIRNRLRAGGPNSVRGYESNTLGDVVRIGDRLDSGGLRMWEASLELRVPLTASIGTVLFADVGDVTHEKRFRLDQPQTTLGFGLRYETLVGPIRLDFAWAPPGLQSIGEDDRQRIAYDQGGYRTAFPESTVWLLGGEGAVHFTIGEAF